jgi:elongation factor 1-gamma
MMRALDVLDMHLAARTFLVGDRISVADILVAGMTQTCAAFAMRARERAQAPHAMRHLETLLASSPGVAAVYGPTMLNETAPAYTPPSEEKPWEKPLDAQPTSKA